MNLPLHPGSRFAVMMLDPEQGIDRAAAKQRGVALLLPVVSEVPGVPGAVVLTVARMSPEGVRRLHDAHIAFPTDGQSPLDIALGGVPDHYVVMMQTWNARYPEEAKYSRADDAEGSVLVDGDDYAIIPCDPDPDPAMVYNAVAMDLTVLTVIPHAEDHIVCTHEPITDDEANHLWELHSAFMRDHADQVNLEAALPNYYIYHDDEVEPSTSDEDAIIMGDPYGPEGDD